MLPNTAIASSLFGSDREKDQKDACCYGADNFF